MIDTSLLFTIKSIIFLKREFPALVEFKATVERNKPGVIQSATKSSLSNLGPPSGKFQRGKIQIRYRFLPKNIFFYMEG